MRSPPAAALSSGVPGAPRCRAPRNAGRRGRRPTALTSRTSTPGSASRASSWSLAGIVEEVVPTRPYRRVRPAVADVHHQQRPLVLRSGARSSRSVPIDDREKGAADVDQTDDGIGGTRDPGPIPVGRGANDFTGPAGKHPRRPGCPPEIPRRAPPGSQPSLLKKSKIAKTSSGATDTESPRNASSSARTQIGRPFCSGIRSRRASVIGCLNASDGGMERLSRGPRRVRCASAISRADPEIRRLPPAAVDRISDHGMADMREVDPDLVGPPGVQFETEQVATRVEPGDAPGSRSGRGGPPRGRPSASGRSVPADRSVDGSGSRRGAPRRGPHTRRLTFRRAASIWPSRRWARSVFATSISPEVSRSSRWTIPGRPSAPPERVVPRATSALTRVSSQWPGAGMDDQPRRLVDDGEVFVLEA